MKEETPSVLCVFFSPNCLPLCVFCLSFSVFLCSLLSFSAWLPFFFSVFFSFPRSSEGLIYSLTYLYLGKI
jgi:hypothetical protein